MKSEIPKPVAFALLGVLAVALIVGILMISRPVDASKVNPGDYQKDPVQMRQEKQKASPNGEGPVLPK